MIKMKIGDLFEFEKGSLQSSKCTEGAFDFITAAQEWKTHNNFSHETEALIFAAMASGSLGRTHYVNGKFITSDLCYIMTPKDSNKYPINLKFYHFVFNSLRDEIVKNTKSGTSKEAISQKNLKNHEIPYFDIEQQDFWIQKLLNTKDIKENLIDEISIQQSLLKKLRQSILQEAIEGKLTASWREQNPDVESASVLLEKIKAEKEQLIKEKKIKKQKPLAPISEDEIPFDIPDGWEWCRLDDISLVGTGATPLTSNNEYYKNGNINWITSSATGSDYVFEAEKKITDKAVLETNCNVNPIGTLVIAMYGQGKTRGQITELAIEAATNQACATINTYLEEKVLTQFIKKYFNMIYLEIRKLAAGGSQPNLNMLKIRKTVLPLPPLKEQKEIVKKIESLFNICDELETQINSSKTNSQTLMQAVLKEAFEEKKEPLSIEEQALISMAYIIDNSKNDNYFGRVKLQKIFYMHGVANNINYGFNYKKHAMGPHDKKRLDYLEEQLSKNRWYQKTKTNDTDKIRYEPLEKKNDYQQYLEALPELDKLKSLIKLMQPLNTKKSEIVATLYAVYKEEKNLFGNIEENRLITKSREWHDNKLNISNIEWSEGIRWLKENRFIEG